MLHIKNLHVTISGKEVLKGLNLTVRQGEIHAIMGPNGAGKSTLAKVLAGHPDYEVTDGAILFHDKNLLDLEPEERSHLGLFLSFQYPLEIPGLENEAFLRATHDAKQKALGLEPLSSDAFAALLKQKMANLEVKESFLQRGLNEGFSGGEKKRNEILQMALLEPSLAVLDETDSGLDIDAMKVISHGINQLLNEQNAVILITHYQRLLDYIKPTYVHVMIDGRIEKTGGEELALYLEKEGYALEC